MILDDFLPGEKVKANSHVIKVRQTSSIILIHGRSRGSFSRRRIFRASCIPRNSFVLENDWMIYHHVYYSPRLFLALWTREDNKIIIYELRLSKLCFPSLQFPFSIENNSHSNFSTRSDPSRQCAPWMNARGAIQHASWLTSENVKSVTIHPLPPSNLSHDPISRMTKWISTPAVSAKGDTFIRGRERERERERLIDENSR